MSFDLGKKIIYVVFDTNTIKKINPNLTKFEFGETYNVLKKFIYGNRINSIKVCVPKIVIEELVTQYIEDYKSAKQRIQDSYDKVMAEANKIGWDINIEKNFDMKNRDYINYIKKSCNEYLSNQENLNLIDLPSESKMSKIIDRSIKKRKPFFKGMYNGKSFSDAGFKDVIFLESIIEFSDFNEGYYMVLTRDNFLIEADFEKEMKCECTAYRIETGIELVGIFNKRYGVIDISKQMNLITSEYYKSKVEDVLKCTILQNVIDINKLDIEGNVIIANHSLVKINDVEQEIVVILSDENDFIEIKDAMSDEVLYEWET